MKLYATVTSERASKGQGGNTRLDIQLTVGTADRQIPAGVIALREIEKGVFTIVYFKDGEGIHLNRIEAKGNKQKDECECGIKQSPLNEDGRCDNCQISI